MQIHGQFDTKLARKRVAWISINENCGDGGVDYSQMSTIPNMDLYISIPARLYAQHFSDQ